MSPTQQMLHEQTFLGAHVRALTVRLAAKDEYTEEHTRRVALRSVQIGEELGRVIDHYEATVQLPLPEKFPKPTRVHTHQGEPCPHCGTTLEAVFYEDYVMSYCPSCQTEGRILKDRRLSRLLK